MDEFTSQFTQGLNEAMRNAALQVEQELNKAMHNGASQLYIDRMSAMFDDISVIKDERTVNNFRNILLNQIKYDNQVYISDEKKVYDEGLAKIENDYENTRNRYVESLESMPVEADVLSKNLGENFNDLENELNSLTKDKEKTDALMNDVVNSGFTPEELTDFSNEVKVALEHGCPPSKIKDIEDEYLQTQDTLNPQAAHSSRKKITEVLHNTNNSSNKDWSKAVKDTKTITRSDIVKGISMKLSGVKNFVQNMEEPDELIRGEASSLKNDIKKTISHILNKREEAAKITIDEISRNKIPGLDLNKLKQDKDKFIESLIGIKECKNISYGGMSISISQKEFRNGMGTNYALSYAGKTYNFTNINELGNTMEKFVKNAQKEKLLSGAKKAINYNKFFKEFTKSNSKILDAAKDKVAEANRSLKDQPSRG